MLAADLPDEAERHRHELGPVIADLAAVDGEERRRRLVGGRFGGTRTGRSRGAAMRVPWSRWSSTSSWHVAGIDRPHIGIGAWALPVIIACGTEEQRQRWVPPTLMGTLMWCQLFSEPGAGSDLAGLSTRAERAEGGWRLTGQKVWTSMAQQADWGICLARTDPAAPKHEGITYFIVDMRSAGPRRPAPARADRCRHVQRGLLGLGLRA